jgi:hypothetical protein
MAALRRDKKATAFFESLNKANRCNCLPAANGKETANEA